MRVCFLNQSRDERTGAGSFLCSLLSGLAAAAPALEHVVLTTHGSSAADERACLPDRAGMVLSAIPAIRRECRRADIIHALDGYPYGVIAALANLGVGTPLIITAIGSGAVVRPERPLARRALSWAYRRADQLVAVSHHTRREMLKLAPDLSIAVINHGVDAHTFSPGAGRSHPEVEALKPYLLSVGAFKPRKGFRYSLEAFAEIRQSFPQLTYVIVGHGERSALDTVIDRLGLGAAVVLFPDVSRPFLIELYRNAELFILLPVAIRGDVEGFGLVFLEAAACGVPVVGTSGCGAEDAVADGQNGFLVSPQNAAAAAAAMQRILRDAGLRERLSRGSRAFARRRSWAGVGERYRELYDQLLRRA